MAEALSFLEEDLTCVICCDVYTDPVTLKCCHSLCEKCLQRFWNTHDVTQCPVCRRECSRDEPTKSLAFKALCETYKDRRSADEHAQTPVSQDICQEHNERFKLFCFEDKKPICVICYTSKKHEHHKCSPVQEAVENIKEVLKKHIEDLQETIAELKKAHDSSMKQAEHIKEHNSVRENHIKKEFEKLHEFLKDEEEKWIRTLSEEVKSEDVQIRARMEQLSTQISDLSDKVAAVWQDMEADDITILQNYTETHQRFQLPNKAGEPETHQHHESTQTMIFTTWARMQKLVETPPVTLDPNTASNRLLVSWDCCSVQYVENKLDVLNNLERLYVGVLASQGFSSGLHCWDVEVGDNNHWTLGVVGETVNRKKLFKMDPKCRFWCFRYVDGLYRKGNKPGIDLDKDEMPHIVRLQLDFEKGELTFTDPFRNKSLCTFTGGFPEKVFPYFCTGDFFRPLNLYPAN